MQDGSSSDDEATRRRSKPTVADVARRVEVLSALPPAMVRQELARARHVDLEDLVILLLGERRQMAAAVAASRGAASAPSGGIEIDYEDMARIATDGTRRGAMAGTSMADRSSTDGTTSRRQSVLELSPQSMARLTPSGRRSHSQSSAGTRTSSRVITAMPVGVRRVSEDPGIELDVAFEQSQEEPARANPLGTPPADRAGGSSSLADRSGSSDPSSMPSPGATTVAASAGTHDPLLVSRDSMRTRHRNLSQLPESHEFRRQSGTPAYVKLRHLFFYQDYVSDHFSDGRSLKATIDELRRGVSTPASIPPLRVARRSTDKKYYSLCNRRLACYHYVFRNDPDVEIPVLLRRELAEHMLPQGDGVGLAVRVGGGVILDGKIVWEIRHCCHQR